MKDADLKRNASGYYDEPCYKVCTAPPKPGEIWQHSRSGDYILILAVNDRVCSILKLTDRDCTDGIQIVCKVPMFTSPAMVAYVFNESIGEYVKSLKEEEFREIQKAVGKALGITATAAVPHGSINTSEERVLELQKLADDLMNKNAELMHEKDDLLKELRYQASILASNELAKMTQEMTRLEIYKDMYIELIDKLVAVRGGTVND